MAYIFHPFIKPKTIEFREYQYNIAKKALESNTLIVLPTGLGKTVIEALVIADLLKKDEHAKILILAPTKPLVLQHAEFLKNVLEVPKENFGVLTGVVRKRDEVWEKQIICATPQTVQNDMEKGLDIGVFKMVVFDEAHRAVKDYSYVHLAKHYVEKAENPHILALTASPGGDIEKINEICKNLFIERVEARSETDPDVAPYVYKRKIEWVKVSLDGEFLEIRELLKKYLSKKLDELQEAGIVNKKPKSKKDILEIQEMLISEGNFGWASKVGGILKVYHAIELLETQGITSLHSFFERMRTQKSRSSKSLLSAPEIQKAMYLVNHLYEKGYEHPKIYVLPDIVKKELRESQKIIIFVQYRDTAKKIASMLKAMGIKAERFVGQASRLGDKGLTQKKQKEILERFRNGEINVLVCTSVGEEGLDIPSVNTVIFYEPVPSEIRFIQRKGRAGRKSEGKIIILMAKGTRDEGYYWVSVKKEKKMKGIIKGMSQKEKQKTLADFVEIKKDNKLLIYVDHREVGSEVVKKLADNPEIYLKTLQLPVADFLISERIAIERKTGKDFLKSIIDGRLFEQAKNMRENFEKPLFLIEGQIEGHNIKENAIYGALISLMVDFGIPVLFSKGPEESAKIIYLLAKREQMEGKKSVRLRGEKKPLSTREWQQFIVESLPGIGPELAKTLLRRFKTVEKIFTANEWELKGVSGIGEKKAKEIRKILTEEWKEEG